MLLCHIAGFRQLYETVSREAAAARVRAPLSTPPSLQAIISPSYDPQLGTHEDVKDAQRTLMLQLMRETKREATLRLFSAAAKSDSEGSGSISLEKLVAALDKPRWKDEFFHTMDLGGVSRELEPQVAAAAIMSLLDTHHEGRLDLAAFALGDPAVREAAHEAEACAYMDSHIEGMEQALDQAISALYFEQPKPSDPLAFLSRFLAARATEKAAQRGIEVTPSRMAMSRTKSLAYDGSRLFDRAIAAISTDSPRSPGSARTPSTPGRSGSTPGSRSGSGRAQPQAKQRSISRLSESSEPSERGGEATERVPSASPLSNMGGVGGMDGGGGDGGSEADTFSEMMNSPRYMALMQKTKSSPSVMAALQDVMAERPNVMAALQDVQRNGPGAMAKYASDPEIASILKELQEVMQLSGQQGS
jgi:hypothetical protein